MIFDWTRHSFSLNANVDCVICHWLCFIRELTHELHALGIIKWRRSTVFWFKRNPACISTIAYDFTTLMWFTFLKLLISTAALWVFWRSCQIKRQKKFTLWVRGGWRHTCPHKHTQEPVNKDGRPHKIKIQGCRNECIRHRCVLGRERGTQTPSGESKASLS